MKTSLSCVHENIEFFLWPSSSSAPHTSTPVNFSRMYFIPLVLFLMNHPERLPLQDRVGVFGDAGVAQRSLLFTLSSTFHPTKPALPPVTLRWSTEAGAVAGQATVSYITTHTHTHAHSDMLNRLDKPVQRNKLLSWKHSEQCSFKGAIDKTDSALVVTGQCQIYPRISPGVCAFLNGSAACLLRVLPSVNTSRLRSGCVSEHSTAWQLESHSYEILR